MAFSAKITGLSTSARPAVAVRASNRVTQSKKSEIIVSPSIASADFAYLGKEVAAIDAAGCDWVHIDIMDGKFVPNITIGPNFVEAIRPYTEKALDCHLMIVEPEVHLAEYIKAGADMITVHAEQQSTIHLHRVINQIKELGCEAGIALNPGTSLSAIEYVLDIVDLVLIMSANPGLEGQKFIESQVRKIRDLKKMCVDQGVNPWIEAYGKITPDNAWKVKDAGANALVAGSAIFKARDEQGEARVALYRDAILGIRNSKAPAEVPA